MENASEGSTMRINVVDTNGNRGVIEYIKEPGNRWQRKNIEGNFNTEKLNEQPLFQRKTTQDGKVQNAELAYGE